jgi:hypothetical protein
MYGDPSYVQGLPQQGPQIATTLPPRMCYSQTRLGGLLHSLAKMGVLDDIALS